MINYRILPEQKLIAISNWGKTTLEDVVKFSQDLRSDPGFFQSYDSIVDNTQLEYTYTPDEIHKLSDPRIDTGKSVGKVAIIAPADITYGVSRMHEIISETKSPHKINVFRDTGSALKWLDREEIDIEIIFEEIKEHIT